MASNGPAPSGFAGPMHVHRGGRAKKVPAGHEGSLDGNIALEDQHRDKHPQTTIPCDPNFIRNFETVVELYKQSDRIAEGVEYLYEVMRRLFHRVLVDGLTSDSRDDKEDDDVEDGDAHSENMCFAQVNHGHATAEDVSSRLTTLPGASRFLRATPHLKRTPVLHGTPLGGGLFTMALSCGTASKIS
ncbi:hypothetical protein C8Q79DRAFT_925196 [Trametes meyenii]|nr:hypothetical protein C8Q79DRAFT_925196 [Trametes meyenii]